MRNLLLTLVLVPSLLAQEQRAPVGGGEAAGLVQVEVEWIELPHEHFTELIAEGGAKRGEEFRARVGKLMRENLAKSLEVQIVTGASGEKLSSGSCKELIFPTEYQQRVMIDPPPPMEIPVPELRDDYHRIFTPTAFETREIGSLLEIEPMVSRDSNHIQMVIEPQLTWHTGNTVWLEHKNGAGNVSKIQMPEIYSLKFHTALRLKPGSCILAAALSPKDAEGTADMSRKVLVFVKADLVSPP